MCFFELFSANNVHTSFIEGKMLKNDRHVQFSLVMCISPPNNGKLGAAQPFLERNAALSTRDASQQYYSHCF
jgi:hypothetical protein